MQNQNRELMTPSMVAAENARFMSRVYGWMTGGILLTSAVAWQIGQNSEMAVAIAQNRVLFWIIFAAQLGLVVVLGRMMSRLSEFAAGAIYFLYASLTGVTLSVIFLIYTGESIFQVFGLTAFAFAGLSAFGFVTKKDLGPIGSFCMMGLFGMVGYAIIGMFFPAMQSGAAGQVYSLVGVVVFAGLTAYDTQKIKQMNVSGYEGTDEERKAAIFGALTLYLDFINLFLSLLRLMGRRK